MSYKKSKLKRFLEKHDITAHELAAECKISDPYLSQILNGHKTPGWLAGKIVAVLRSKTGKHRGRLTVGTIFEQVDARYVVKREKAESIE